MYLSAGKEISLAPFGPLLITVTGKQQWSDAVWDEYTDAGVRFQQEHGPFSLILTIVPGNSTPTAAQRQRIAQKGAVVFKTVKKAVLLTNSALVRGVVQAISWLTRPVNEWT